MTAHNDNNHHPMPTPGPACAPLAGQLPLLVAGGLTPNESAALAAHVSDCAWCQRRLREYEALVAALRQEANTPLQGQPLTVADLLRADSTAPVFEEETMPYDQRATPAATPATTPATTPRISPESARVRPDQSYHPRRETHPRLAALGALAAALLIIALAAALFSRQSQQPAHSPLYSVTIAPTMIPARRALLAPGIATFPLPARDSGVSDFYARAEVGSDGNLWLLRASGRQALQVTPQGAMKQFAIPVAIANRPLSGFADIIAAPDGALWLTSPLSDTIWRLNPRTFRLTRYPIPAGKADEQLQSLAASRDGAIWFTQGNDPFSPRLDGRVGRLDPRTGAVRFYALPHGGSAGDMALGSDGNLWFALSTNDIGIARLDLSSGAITVFAVPNPRADVNGPGSNPPQRLTLGRDGAIWFFLNNSNTAANRVGYMTPSGAVKTFLPPDSIGPYDIIALPDSSVWALLGNGFLRVSPDGAMKRLVLPDFGRAVAQAATLGPDGAVWMVYQQGSGDSPQYLAQLNPSLFH